MGGSRITIGLLATAVVLTAGCASSPWSSSETSAVSSSVQPAADPSPTDMPRTASTGHPAPEALSEVIAEIRELQVLDPAAEAELLESLCQTPPDLWPLVVQQFRAAAAYRRQANESQPGTLGQLGATGDSPMQGGSHEQDARGTLMANADGPTHDMEPPAASRAGALPSEIGTEQTSAAEPVVPPSSYPETSDGPNDDVIATAYMPKTSADWQEHVIEAVRALESNVSQAPESSEEVAQHARLRMLYLISGQREDALRPIPTATPSTQDFWSKELYGLATLLDTERFSGPTRRAAEAKRHLAEAATRLGDVSPLLIRNLAFVTEVQGYGTFEPFDPYEFSPGQRLLLYAEVENFKSNQTAKGFHTALRSSYQIFDAGGRLVTDHEFDTNEEQCRNPRRDFFIGYEFSLPDMIYAGKHVLRLTVEDVNSGKIGQSSIEFTISMPDA